MPDYKCPVSLAERTGQRGFSLLELLIVLLIIGLTAALVFPSVNRNSEKRSLDETLMALETALLDARAQAQRTGIAAYIEFDPKNREFVASDGPLFAVPENLDIELKTSGHYSTPRVAFLPSGQSSGAEFDLETIGFSASMRVDWLTSAIHTETRTDRSR